MILASESEEPTVAAHTSLHAEVLTILSDNCFACHGPDGAKRKAGLRLDTPEGLLAVTKHGAAVVPGNAALSRVIQRIEDTADPMPPESHPALSEKQKQTLRQWINAGAVQPQHWAFVPPRRIQAPEVKQSTWTRNLIDSFILARLEREKIAPAEQANRWTLVRRVYLDLTGLPPTPEQAQAFVRDTRADAYERLVDRLLASPRCGEHLARFWLDLSRYGDTHGLHFDNYREAWPYRDYVIRSFNDNKPLDRFLTEQLAGDLLPGATTEQRVATGFLRNQTSTGDIDSIPEEEARFMAVSGMTETVATATLGLTLGCAKCHDHKYDPLTQRDYYSLFAFFNSNEGVPYDFGAAYPHPAMAVPTSAELLRDYLSRVKIADIEKKIADQVARIDAKIGAGPSQPQPRAPRDYVWIDDQPEKAEYVRFEAPPEDCHFTDDPQYPILSGKQSLRMSGNSQMLFWISKLKPTLIVGKGDHLVAHVWIDPDSPPRQLILEWLTDDWNHRAFWGEHLILQGKLGTPSLRRMGEMPEGGKWVRLEVPAQLVGLTPGTEVRGVGLRQIQGSVFWDKIGSRTCLALEPTQYAQFVDWEVEQRNQQGHHLPPSVRQALLLKHDQRTNPQQKLLRDHFLVHACSTTCQNFTPLVRQLREAERELEDLHEKMPRSLVFQETTTPRPAHVHRRGEWNLPLEKVKREVPAVFSQLHPQVRRDRLGLAHWLTQRENPLASRVAVNRLWQQVFGHGIVRTPEDFGLRGAAPHHPELLDRLAVDFQLSGWDIKRMLRQFVLSATYQQSARLRPELTVKDPQNHLLARSSRVRLDAEVLRDQALLIGGLLVERIGGPSVKPPQPGGISEAVATGSSNTRFHVSDTAVDKIYRRSAYTFWKRTAHSPQMSVLDAPSRETCVCRRERTNTPLQALLLLNEEQFVEAAKALALRVRENKDLKTQLTQIFLCAVTRPPTASELRELRSSYEAHLQHYRKHRDLVRQLANDQATPEFAALWAVAGTVLNLDEVWNRP
jgi:mono/diheme cytochrome c family protein